MKTGKYSPDPATEMRDLLAEIDRVLPMVKWKRCKDNRTTPPSEFFEGTTHEWYFVSASFSIEEQGFPPGSRGYDGIGRKGSTVIRFTRPLAERVFKEAARHA
jgi:hypothetical protein